ncbi:hypothetical protein Hanom_Chr12g01136981 [Helianthus anomalus]
MILATCTNQKTQGTTFRCIKRLEYKRRVTQAKKAQKNPKKARLFRASCNYSSR